MSMRAKPSATGIRSKILDPLRNFKHEVIEVAEWDSAKVIVRALSAGDWLEYRHRAVQQVQAARVAAGLLPGWMHTARINRAMPPSIFSARRYMRLFWPEPCLKRRASGFSVMTMCPS